MRDDRDAQSDFVILSRLRGSERNFANRPPFGGVATLATLASPVQDRQGRQGRQQMVWGRSWRRPGVRRYNPPAQKSYNSRRSQRLRSATAFTYAHLAPAAPQRDRSTRVAPGQTGQIGLRPSAPHARGALANMANRPAFVGPHARIARANRANSCAFVGSLTAGATARSTSMTMSTSTSTSTS